jgi:hypothetical protein
MYLQINMQNNCFKKISYLLASLRSMMTIAGSGSTPKCHGSATLLYVYLVCYDVDRYDNRADGHAA